MTLTYIIVLICLLFGVGVCCFLAGRQKSEYSGTIIRLLCSGMIAMVSYIIFLLCTTQRSALFFNNVYYASIDWILLCLMAYAFQYTDTSFYRQHLRTLFLVLGWIDTFLMLLNSAFSHAFTIKRDTFGNTGIEYWSVDFRTYEYIHLAFCYVMTIVIFYVLISKMVKSPRIYRKKYLSTIVMFIIVLVLNATCYSIDAPYDYSLLFYMLFAMSICYFTLYSNPRGLVEDTLMDAIGDMDSGVICFDNMKKCLYVNNTAADILQTDRENRQFFEQYLLSCMENESGAVWEETRILNGEEHFINVTYQRLHDEKDATTGYSIKLTDATNTLIRLRNEQYNATHDRLTGLYNREYFFKKAEEIIKNNPDVERYMICTNIHNFKLVNDLFGEETGDRVLTDQAGALRFANYKDCIQGRISGDKFAMLIAKEHFNPELAMANTGKLQYLIQSSNYKLQVYIGVYKIVDPMESPQVMFDKASMAIDSNKGDFQKMIVYYDENMLHQLVREKNIVNEFEYALQEGQFKMYLQPIVGQDGKPRSAEALVRWAHPTQGLIMPINFLSIVEKSGMINRLDEYVWEMAARKLRDWKYAGIDTAISVNISAKDFYYSNLYEKFTDLVKKYEIDPGKLNLEITETVMMADLEQHLDTIQRLREYGFVIELDDFGSGYSSLNTLKDIYVDTLKIDMKFLRESEVGTRGHIILSSVIRMAKELEMTVITEGVETAEQMEDLIQMGSDLFQGYYFSKPIAADEFEKKYFGV